MTLITPKRLSRFGIEVDEALRVGGSGFLGGSDTGEIVCESLYIILRFRRACDQMVGNDPRRTLRQGPDRNGTYPLRRRDPGSDAFRRGVGETSGGVMMKIPSK